MSVLARLRKLSQYEFYVNALHLRKSMRFLLLRDLGIKDKVVEGKMSLRDFKISYKSWRNDKKRYNAYYTLKALDNYERKLISWISQTRLTPYLRTV